MLSTEVTPRFHHPVHVHIFDHSPSDQPGTEGQGQERGGVPSGRSRQRLSSNRRNRRLQGVRPNRRSGLPPCVPRSLRSPSPGSTAPSCESQLKLNGSLQHAGFGVQLLPQPVRGIGEQGTPLLLASPTTWPTSSFAASPTPDFFLGTLGRRLFLSRFRVCVRGRHRYLPVFPWLSPLGFSSRAINTRHGSGANSHNGKAPLPVKSDEFQDVQETCCDDGCSDRRATPVDQAVMVVRMSINPSSPVG